jgi:hypothetical protein
MILQAHNRCVQEQYDATSQKGKLPALILRQRAVVHPGTVLKLEALSTITDSGRLQPYDLCGIRICANFAFR